MPEIKRRSAPEFEMPRFERPQSGAGFLFGGLLWILMIVVFLFVAYTQLLTFNLVYLLNLIRPKNYQIPFWFSALCVIFLFPFTLCMVLIGTLIRIIKD